MNVSSKNIPWKELGYPQVPKLLKDLISDDSNLQSKAVQELEDKLVLGGLNWQDFDLGKGISVALRNDAPVLVVPYLLKLLEPNVNSIKTDILYLLQRMQFYIRMLNEGDIYNQRAAQIRDIIWEGRYIYLDLLSSKDISIRRLSLGILIDFTEASRIVEAHTLIAQRFSPILSQDTDSNK